MAMKTFNVEEDVYLRFSRFCKENGINMSKQVEMFMKSFVDEEPEARKEYLEKLDRIRKGKFIRVEKFSSRYGV